MEQHQHSRRHFLWTGALAAATFCLTGCDMKRKLAAPDITTITNDERENGLTADKLAQRKDALSKFATSLRPQYATLKEAVDRLDKDPGAFIADTKAIVLTQAALNQAIATLEEAKSDTNFSSIQQFLAEAINNCTQMREVLASPSLASQFTMLDKAENDDQINGVVLSLKSEESLEIAVKVAENDLHALNSVQKKEIKQDGSSDMLAIFLVAHYLTSDSFTSSRSSFQGYSAGSNRWNSISKEHYSSYRAGGAAKNSPAGTHTGNSYPSTSSRSASSGNSSSRSSSSSSFKTGGRSSGGFGGGRIGGGGFGS